MELGLCNGPGLEVLLNWEIIIHVSIIKFLVELLDLQSPLFLLEEITLIPDRTSANTSTLIDSTDALTNHATTPFIL